MSAPARFLRWWSAELWALTPRPLRRLLAPTRPLLLAASEGGDVSLILRRGRTERLLGRLTDLPPQRVRRLARERTAGRLTCGLSLPADAAVVRTVALPLAAERDLRAVLGFEMDRLTPFAAHEVWFAAHPLARNTARNTLDVEVAFAPRAPHAAALSAMAAAGLSPDCALSGNRVLAAPEAVERNGRSIGVKLALAGVLTLGLAAAGWSAVALRRLETQAVTLENHAAALRRAALARIDAADAGAPDGPADLAAAARAGRPAAGATLAALSDLLPDGVWLTGLRLTPDAIEITGYAADAAALVHLLEAAPAFAAPRFVSPVTREPGTGRERFSLTARLNRAAEGAP